MKRLSSFHFIREKSNKFCFCVLACQFDHHGDHKVESPMSWSTATSSGRAIKPKTINLSRIIVLLLFCSSIFFFLYLFTWWTNTSWPPSSGVIKPHPLFILNHLHLPRRKPPVFGVEVVGVSAKHKVIEKILKELSLKIT